MSKAKPAPQPQAVPALLAELEEAEQKAWEALSRYKFWMFGYWAGVWVHLNRISGLRRPNPWRALVNLAREQVGKAPLGGG